MSERFGSTLKPQLPREVQRAFDRCGDTILQTGSLPDYKRDPEVCRLRDTAEGIFRSLSAASPDSDYVGALVAANDLAHGLERKMHADSAILISIERHGRRFLVDEAFHELARVTRCDILTPGHSAVLSFEYAPDSPVDAENFRFVLTRPSHRVGGWKVSFSEGWFPGMSRYPHAHNVLREHRPDTSRFYARLHDDGVSHLVEIELRERELDAALALGKRAVTTTLNDNVRLGFSSQNPIITIPELCRLHGIPNSCLFDGPGQSLDVRI